MEAKVAKMPIESFSVLGLQNMKMFLVTINLLFRSILVALKRGLFPIYYIRLEKKFFKTSKFTVILGYCKIFEDTFFQSYMIDRKKSPVQGY